ncbi:sulfotransferase family protein [Alicyclobacillus macrosporangiidus]|uniref:Sulfotransferase family protein n=1 Tax=Alicyclobacillus macrosporangiidus TaxID=392015 RepID=A0A1I7F618_9BACL|nr:sulfotransferase [Alicyclobacillus macrosporangiidus]SFU31632.1 Sulfotransferase family protein [Alicyclobacillus macrosporangiidus]
MIPNFFIIGSAKAGTSSLQQYLSQHPQVFMSAIKEPHYLCAEHFPPKFTGPGDEGFSEHITRTREQYLSLFAKADGYRVIGEASVYYLSFPSTAQRIKELNPAAKLVAVLRNPVDRAFSAYLHTVRDGRETLTFEEALAAEPDRKQRGYQPLWWYREIGLYSKGVAEYLRVFGPDQIKVYLYEDLKNIARVLHEIFHFMGIEPLTIDTSIRYNVSGIPKSRFLYTFFAQPNWFKNALKPLFPTALRQRLGHRAKALTLRKVEMRPETKRELQEYYRDDILALQELLHRDLSHWLT